MAELHIMADQHTVGTQAYNTMHLSQQTCFATLCFGKVGMGSKQARSLQACVARRERKGYYLTLPQIVKPGHDPAAVLYDIETKNYIPMETYNDVSFHAAHKHVLSHSSCSHASLCFVYAIPEVNPLETARHG